MSYQLTWLFLIIAIAAIVMNVLLIKLANRTSQKPCEVKLAVILAKIDLVLPTLAIIALLIKLISGKDITLIPGACQVKGAIDYIGMYLSMVLVAVVSFSRVSLKSQLKVTGGLKFFIIGYTTVFCILIITAAFCKKFTILPNGIDCAPLLLTDALSTTVTLVLGFSLMLCLLITLGCYISRRFRILIGDYQDSVIPLPDRALSSFTDKPIPLSQSNRLSIIIRTTAICGTYFLLIVPACILLMIEAVIDSKYSPRISNIIDVCFASIALVNPSLLLFTHSFFTRQLQCLI